MISILWVKKLRLYKQQVAENFLAPVILATVLFSYPNSKNIWLLAYIVLLLFISFKKIYGLVSEWNFLHLPEIN